MFRQGVPAFVRAPQYATVADDDDEEKKEPEHDLALVGVCTTVTRGVLL